MVNFGEVWRAQLAESTLRTSTLVPLGYFKILSRSVQILERESGVRKEMGSYRILFIFSKTSTMVPEFAVGDLPLVRTAALVPEFAAKDLLLGRTL